MQNTGKKTYTGQYRNSWGIMLVEEETINKQKAIEMFIEYGYSSPEASLIDALGDNPDYPVVDLLIALEY